MVRRNSGEAPRRRWSAGAGDFVVDESPARSSLRQFSSHVRRTTVVAAKARLSRKMGDALAAGEDHEKEMSDNLWRHHRLLLPTSRRKDQWDVFVLLLVLWNCVYIPLQMAFQVRNAVHTTAQDYVLTAVDYLIDVAFLVDIGVNFRTTFYNSHHELVIEPRAIPPILARIWIAGRLRGGPEIVGSARGGQGRGVRYARSKCVMNGGRSRSRAAREYI